MAKKMLILGGDLRLLTVADEFIKDGYDVGVYGIDSKYFERPYNTYVNTVSAVSENEIILLGLPASRDGITVSTPYFNEKIYIDDFISATNGKKIIMGGMLSSDIQKKLTGLGCICFDYFEREELIIKNVIPTVEGAISIAIEETPHTIHGSDCLVCGFGRIGKLLSKTLAGLGAHVTVSSRKLKDAAWIECYGYSGIHTDSIEATVNKYDIIFNTVPHNVLTHGCLDKMNKDSLIIDLASKPGGLDFEYAKIKGIKTVWALSLPGKTAPHTAGLIIKNTIYNILTELEE